LGIGCMLAASMLYFWVVDGKPDAQEVLITLFLFITAPVSAHLMAKTGLHMQLRHVDKTQGRPFEMRDEEIGEKPVLHPDRGHG
jgi:multicomponent K+:H+ antiporter subunit G